ncbi:MAG: hypothetical protein K9N48_04095 [Verrucomicrobia bacterium]|nr:hypothetical protein [Verrucomicrobiota bacterium]
MRIAEFTNQRLRLTTILYYNIRRPMKSWPHFLDIFRNIFVLVVWEIPKFNGTNGKNGRFMSKIVDFGVSFCSETGEGIAFEAAILGARLC